ncbi:hypothetical protein ATR1_405d0002, partial [Acetobacter tropicalis]
GVAGSVFPDFRTPRGARNPSGEQNVRFPTSDIKKADFYG